MVTEQTYSSDHVYRNCRNICSLYSHMPHRISLTRQVQERRRLRAIQLRERGWSTRRIADSLGVSLPAVYQWFAAVERSGIDALTARARTGAPRRMTDRHRRMLELLLTSPPREHGIDAQQWDRNLVQRAIKRLFDIDYSKQHCGRILRDIQTHHRRQPYALDELRSMLSKVDIARIRKRLGADNGSRRT